MFRGISHTTVDLLRRSIPILVLFALGACKGFDRDGSPVDLDTFVEVLEVGQANIAAAQGALFSVDVKVRRSDMTYGDPRAVTVVTPEGLALEDSEYVPASQSLRFDLRGLEAFKGKLQFRHPELTDLYSLPTEIVQSEVRILPGPWLDVEEGEKHVTLLSGEEFPITAAVFPPGGNCPIPGAASIIEGNVVGDINDFTISPFSRVPVNLEGCPDADNAGLLANFFSEVPTRSIGVSYDVRGDSDRTSIGVWHGRYTGIIPVDEFWKDPQPGQWQVLTNSESSCGPVEAQTYDFAGTIGAAEGGEGLEVISTDGGVWRGVEGPEGAWSFSADPVPAGPEATAQEIWEEDDISFQREENWEISMGWRNRTVRIDYALNGEFVCDQKAKQDASFRVPRDRFRALVRFRF